MAGKRKATSKKSGRKAPVGADGLNKYQRYYQKKKSLAQSKLGKEETIGSGSDEMRPTSQELGDNNNLSTDSVAEPPHNPPRLFFADSEHETETNLEEVNEELSPKQQSSRNAPCLNTPSVDAFFSSPELSVSRNSLNVDWRPPAHTLHSSPESLPSHDLFSSDWRPPTQVTPSADDPSIMSHSIRDNFTDFRLYLETRDIIATWSGYWSGMDNWPRALNEAFERHKGYGPDGAAKFLRKLWLHEQRGRQLLHRIQLRLTGSALPSNPQALMELWNLQQDQVMVLTRGLTIMELTGSLALHYVHSIGMGEVIDAIPSALSASNTPLFPPAGHNLRQTEREEEDVESYLKGSS